MWLRLEAATFNANVITDLDAPCVSLSLQFPTHYVAQNVDR